jgi:hypothetical protein
MNVSGNWLLRKELTDDRGNRSETNNDQETDNMAFESLFQLAISLLSSIIIILLLRNTIDHSLFIDHTGGGEPDLKKHIFTRFAGKSSLKF